jgi:hypothetical protein
LRPGLAIDVGRHRIERRRLIDGFNRRGTEVKVAGGRGYEPFRARIGAVVFEERGGVIAEVDCGVGEVVSGSPSAGLGKAKLDGERDVAV